MWTDLKPEIEALRRQCFGKEYQRLRDSLDPDKQTQLLQLETLFLDLVSYITGDQEEDGSWPAQYKTVITAHAVRLLHRMGIPLQARWYLPTGIINEGNLYRATKWLLNSFHRPTKDKHARWGLDFWDDCYVLLALFEVRPDWNREMEQHFKDNFAESREFLIEQVKDSFQHYRGADWFGPGFHAAGIELFDYLITQEKYSGGAKIIDALADSVKPMLDEAVNGSSPLDWESHFAWHAGQFLATWKEKSGPYPSLQSLQPLVTKLFDKLEDRQNKKTGAWPSPDEADRIYFTVRALAAHYVWNSPQSESARHAHKYLLRVASGASDAPLTDVKACINAVDAFQKLFEFNVRDIYPNAFLSLVARLNYLSLSDAVFTPSQPNLGMLETVRTAARIKLEDHGEYDAELVGANARLYDKLDNHVLSQFTGDRGEILKELKRFLSSTMTETRCNSSQKLIRKLWGKQGFLNFIPLINHLSTLEKDRAFYKYYRDHLNHEVLLFLLGAYIYFNCSTFRDKINEEIFKKAPGRNMEESALPAEFLFRWKLISTFHDIGYLFEVDPDNDVPSSTGKTRKQLLDSSFDVVEKVREKFLYDYFMQYLITGDTAAKESKARALVDSIWPRIKEYQPSIRDVNQLRTLNSTDKYKHTFKLISRFVESEHIPEDLIERYFELCRNTEVKKPKRSSFLDHGIMSALVLLKTADIQRYYLKQLSDFEFAGELEELPELQNILHDENTRRHLDEGQFFTRFSHVAGAIALHNIYPHLYTKDQCKAFDADQMVPLKLQDAFHSGPVGKGGRFAITLDENPLAYLTRVADALQDWDRHSFRRLAFAEDSGDPLSSSEVVIKCKEEKIGDENRCRIHVLALTKNARKRYKDLRLEESLLDCENYLAIEG